MTRLLLVFTRAVSVPRAQWLLFSARPQVSIRYNLGDLVIICGYISPSVRFSLYYCSHRYFWHHLIRHADDRNIHSSDTDRWRLTPQTFLTQPDQACSRWLECSFQWRLTPLENKTYRHRLIHNSSTVQYHDKLRFEEWWPEAKGVGTCVYLLSATTQKWFDLILCTILGTFLRSLWQS